MAPAADLCESLQPVQVTADFDIAVVAVPSQVVKLVHVNAVAAIGHNVEEEPFVIQGQGAIAGWLVVGTGPNNQLLDPLHVYIIEGIILDVAIVYDGLQDFAAHLLVTPA